MKRLPTLLLSALFCLALSACSSHSYHAEAIQYLKVAEGVLVGHGVCSDERDCQARNLLFFEAGEVSLGIFRWGGIHVNLYESNNLEAVEEVASKFKELHIRLREPAVTLTAYSSKHTESNYMQ